MASIRPQGRTAQVLKFLKNATSYFRSGVRGALYEVGRENVKYTRKLILDKNKNGRRYRIRGRIHQASAPGEAPANSTGALQKTVDYTVRGVSQVEFGDKIEYGKYLEDGTRNKDGSQRMAARQHIIATVNARHKDVINALCRYVAVGVKRNANVRRR